MKKQLRAHNRRWIKGSRKPTTSAHNQIRVLDTTAVRTNVQGIDPKGLVSTPKSKAFVNNPDDGSTIVEQNKKSACRRCQPFLVMCLGVAILVSSLGWFVYFDNIRAEFKTVEQKKPFIEIVGTKGKNNGNGHNDDNGVKGKNDARTNISNEYSTGRDNSTSSSSNIIEWVRPSPLEIKQIQTSNQKSCNRPFRHCCLGQCRFEKLTIGEIESLWKPVRRGQGGQFWELSNVLQYNFYNRSNTNDSNNSNISSSCNIVWAGDSLSMDHVMASVCQLIEDGYELKSCNVQIGLPSYGSDLQIQCAENVHPGKLHFLLSKANQQTCPEVLILGIKSGGVPKWFWQETQDWGGIVVFNWGARCNDKTDKFGCIKSYLKPFLKLAKYDKFSKWKFLFRETEPQHFNTKDGLYVEPEDPSNRTSSFRQCSKFSGTPDNWRNEAVVKILEWNNLTARVPVIPIFSALEPLTQNHIEGDCTHYCYNPLRFRVTWDGLYNALKEYNGSLQ